jgi:hypothetical protein
MSVTLRGTIVWHVTPTFQRNMSPSSVEWKSKPTRSGKTKALSGQKAVRSFDTASHPTR